jgi:hypothetical protein
VGKSRPTMADINVQPAPDVRRFQGNGPTMRLLTKLHLTDSPTLPSQQAALDILAPQHPAAVQAPAQSFQLTEDESDGPRWGIEMEYTHLDPPHTL